jgi:hypothetical protein
MSIAKTAREVDCDLLVAETAREHITNMFKRLSEKAEALARSPWVRIRARVSLASGALFVLSSLFLPLAMNSCGTRATGPGLDILLAKSDAYWPSYTFSFFEDSNPVIYGFLLAIAVCTLLAVPSERDD